MRNKFYFQYNIFELAWYHLTIFFNNKRRLIRKKFNELVKENWEISSDEWKNIVSKPYAREGFWKNFEAIILKQNIEVASAGTEKLYEIFRKSTCYSVEKALLEERANA